MAAMAYENSALVATFMVARLTLQTRKLWFVGWCRDRPSRAVPLTAPNVKIFLKNKSKWKETKAKKKIKKKRT